MAIPNRQLFLDRFIDYNVERYEDNPKLVAVLQGLTLDKVTISNYQIVDDAENLTHSYSIYMPGVFIGEGQQFQPADVRLGLLFNSLGHVEDVAELARKSDEGVYTVGVDKSACLLVHHGKVADEEHVLNQVKLSSKYDLLDGDLSYVLKKASISNETIFGDITVYESLFDDMPRFNGQYRCDGSVSAL